MNSENGYVRENDRKFVHWRREEETRSRLMDEEGISGRDGRGLQVVNAERGSHSYHILFIILALH